MDPQSDKPELAWSLSDYQAHEQEAPDRLHDQPLACEGELMTEDEIEQYCRDGIATLMILRDKDSARTEAVHHAFVADLDFLLSIGRISLDDYNELINDATFEF